jgi:hypothetical protein
MAKNIQIEAPLRHNAHPLNFRPMRPHYQGAAGKQAQDY